MTGPPSRFGATWRYSTSPMSTKRPPHIIITSRHNFEKVRAIIRAATKRVVICRVRVRVRGRE
ncbi:hypothetical protein LINGRAPRIM_LOCUS2845 [Linum grandiflorum]